MKITRRQLKKLIAEQVLIVESREDAIKAFLKDNPDAKGKAIGIAKIRKPSKVTSAFSLATKRMTMQGGDILKKETRKQFEYNGKTYAVVYKEKS